MPNFGTRLFGSSPFSVTGGVASQPAPPGTAANLPQAVQNRLEVAGSLAAITGFYESQAGDRAVLPYAVYQITSDPTYYTSSSSHWTDQRVTVKIVAETQEQADDLRETAHAALGTGDYTFSGGFAIPFFVSNRSEGKEHGRFRNATYAFRSTIEYSARTRRG